MGAQAWPNPGRPPAESPPVSAAASLPEPPLLQPTAATKTNNVITWFRFIGFEYELSCAPNLCSKFILGLVSAVCFWSRWRWPRVATGATRGPVGLTRAPGAAVPRADRRARQAEADSSATRARRAAAEAAAARAEQAEAAALAAPVGAAAPVARPAAAARAAAAPLRATVRSTRAGRAREVATAPARTSSATAPTAFGSSAGSRAARQRPSAMPMPARPASSYLRTARASCCRRAPRTFLTASAIRAERRARARFLRSRCEIRNV